MPDLNADLMFVLSYQDVGMEDVDGKAGDYNHDPQTSAPSAAMEDVDGHPGNLPTLPGQLPSLKTAGFTPGVGSKTYRMRARDTTLARIVFWDAVTNIDATGAQYDGPGPLTDIVLWEVLG